MCNYCQLSAMMVNNKYWLLVNIVGANNMRITQCILLLMMVTKSVNCATYPPFTGTTVETIMHSKTLSWAIAEMTGSVKSRDSIDASVITFPRVNFQLSTEAHGSPQVRLMRDNVVHPNCVLTIHNPTGTFSHLNFVRIPGNYVYDSKPVVSEITSDCPNARSVIINSESVGGTGWIMVNGLRVSINDKNLREGIAIPMHISSGTNGDITIRHRLTATTTPQTPVRLLEVSGSGSAIVQWLHGGADVLDVYDALGNTSPTSSHVYYGGADAPYVIYARAKNTVLKNEITVPVQITITVK